jgi:hypothetical protein
MLRLHQDTLLGSVADVRWVPRHWILVIGILLAAYSISAPEELAVRILLLAACSLLASCGTVLFSILTLLFYLGSTLMRDDDNLPQTTTAKTH